MGPLNIGFTLIIDGLKCIVIGEVNKFKEKNSNKLCKGFVLIFRLNWVLKTSKSRSIQK